MPESAELQRSKTVWDYKPWWCQPWSILLTGVGIITGSWVLMHSRCITVLVDVPILLWMGYFLLVYPQLVVQSGLLDLKSSPEDSSS